MRIKIQQFLFGQRHSWSFLSKEIARNLIKMNNDVELISTDGVKEEFIPEDLKKYMRLSPSGNYDMQFSYTCMINFDKYLNSGIKNRFGQWVFEWDVLPPGFAKNVQYCDLFLPPCKWFYDVCVENKIPENKMKVLPHGVDWEKFFAAQPMQLKTKKSIKLFLNVCQVHRRKNLKNTLEVFGKAFSKNDDVALIIKASDKKPVQMFDLSFWDIYNEFNKKYPNHAEVEIYNNYIPKIEELYKACDVLFMLPNAEGFGLYFLEALASGLVVMAPRYGAQLDFLNDDNSVLVNTKKVRTPKNHMYWQPSSYASMGEPEIDDAVDKIRYIVNNLSELKQKHQASLTDDYKKTYSWQGVADKLVSWSK